jgi:hypothetical protein
MVIDIINQAFKTISQETPPPVIIASKKKLPTREKSRSPFKKRKTKEIEAPISPKMIIEQESEEENPLEFIIEQVKSAGVEPPNPEYIPQFKDILEQM